MIFSQFFKKKVIYHTGAWSGNFGDSIIQQSIQNGLSQLSKRDLQFRYINCQQTEFTREIIEEINSEGDLLIVGGGGLIFYRPKDNSKSGWQWNIDINLIDQLRVPLVIYGIGYNQFEYDNSNFIPITNKHLQTTVEKAALCSVRNSGSKKELMIRGCNGSKIKIIPDSGMFLKPKKIDIPGFIPSKLHIGFNWTTDRENQTFPHPFEDNRDKFINSCIELLNYIIKTKNAQIFHIGHMSYDFDNKIIKILKNNLILEPIIIDDVLKQIYPPSGENARYLVDVYRQMDIVLGMRGHSNIVSFGQNIPFIGLGSHRKIRYFLEDIDRKEYFFDVRPEGDLYNLDFMKAKIDKLLNKYIDERNNMEEKYNQESKKFNDFNYQVLKLLK